MKRRRRRKNRRRNKEKEKKEKKRARKRKRKRTFSHTPNLSPLLATPLFYHLSYPSTPLLFLPFPLHLSRSSCYLSSTTFLTLLLLSISTLPSLPFSICRFSTLSGQRDCHGRNLGITDKSR